MFEQRNAKLKLHLLLLENLLSEYLVKLVFGFSISCGEISWDF